MEGMSESSKKRVRGEEKGVGVESSNSSSSRRRDYKDPVKWLIWEESIVPTSKWLDTHIGFVIQRKMGIVHNLTHNIESKDSFEKAKCLEQLGELVASEPRLCDALPQHLLLLLLDFLKGQETPEVKAYATVIFTCGISFSKYRDTFMNLIDAPLLIQLMSSQIWQALFLLRSIALVFPNGCKSILNEGVFDSLVSFVKNGVTDFDLLLSASKALSAVCQEIPELPTEMLKSALSALLALIENEASQVIKPACIGLAHLHNGNKKLLIEDKDKDEVYSRLVDIIDNGNRGLVIVALEAVGSILRWGDDDDTEYFLYYDVLPVLGKWLGENDMDVLPRLCWVISNITASNEKHIKAVIEANLIDPLVKIIETSHFDAKSEAAWAISNAIVGASSDEIEYLRRKCIKPLCDLLDCSDCQVVIVCLEGLVRLQAVEVRYCGVLIDNALGYAKMKKLIYGERFRPLKKSKGHGSSKIYGDGLVVIPTCSLGEDPQPSWRTVH